MCGEDSKRKDKKLLKCTKSNNEFNLWYLILTVAPAETEEKFN